MMSALLITLFASCSSGKEDDPSGSNGSPENSRIEDTKWTNRSFDFAIADDLSWGYFYTDVTNIYFYDNSHGIFYYSRKTEDSDDGHSRTTRICFFEYEVDGSTVYLEPITPTTPEFPYTLDLSDDVIVYGGEYMYGETIDYSDRQWISSYCGSLGSSEWFCDKQGNLVIIGNGAIPDYSSYGETPWSNNLVSSVTIDKGITKMGAYAFADVSLGDVTFKGDNITEIGRAAFQGSAIGTVYLPDNITTVGTDAFNDCKYAKIVLPSKIETIGAGAFADCKEVSMRNTPNLRRIEDFAFNNSNVTSWTNSDKLEYIGNCAISYSGTSVNLPAVRELRHLSIYGNKLNEVHIGSSLSSVTGTPFYGSTSGKFYIAQTEPLKLTYDIVDNISGWTLYVPKGSESAYRQAAHWNKFKTIIGTSDLGISDGGGSSDDDKTEGVITYDNAECGIFDATLNGEIRRLSPTSYTYSFELSKNSSLGSDVKTVTATINGSSLSCYINTLEPNTTYYYRAIAKNGSIWFAGKVYSFTTSQSRIPSTCTYTLNGIEYKMVKVTGHHTGDFYIMQTELPPSAIFAVDNITLNRYLLDGNSDRAVIKSEFKDFLIDLRMKTGIAFRLPTKSEWQYAAKGGQYSKGYKYSGSDDLASVGWFNCKSLHDPALLQANELGLYDMSGNYSEVVNDNATDMFYVDGDLCGGNFKSTAAQCTPTSSTPGLVSGTLSGTQLKNKNAFDAKLNTVRLVYSAY